MAVFEQKLAAQQDNELQGSTHDNIRSNCCMGDQSSSCRKYEEQQCAGKVDMIAKRTRRGEMNRATSSLIVPPPLLMAFPPQRKISWRARRSQTTARLAKYRHANSKVVSIMKVMKRLRCKVNSIRSLLPPTTRPSRPCSDNLADALRYRNAMEKEIELLSTALSYLQQVDVKRVDCGALHIRISCVKKSGLMAALMETMESFGLQFSNVSVSCADDSLIIDALSTKENVGNAEALKGRLVATIIHSNRI